MTEIEDERSAVETVQDALRCFAHAVTPQDQPARIEIALHDHLVLQSIARPGRIDRLIDTQRVADTSLGEIAIAGTDAARKHDDWDIRRALPEPCHYALN